MAQNQFINITIGPNASNVPAGQDQRHGSTQGTAAANDLTLSFDSAKFTTLSLLTSGVMAALKIAAGQLPK